MVITYYGLSCFKISSGELVLAFDPPSKKSSFKSPRFKADAVFISHKHDDHSGYDMIADKDGKLPLKIDSPGEYEMRGISIKGIPSYHDASSGKKEGLNVIYTAEVEGIKLCHMGDFGEKELRSETAEAIGKVDILLIPVGGKTVIGPETAAKITAKFEPKIVIPMHHEKKTLGEFLKEMGVESLKPEERLTLKKKDLPEGKAEVRVLKPAI